ncbi:Ribonuclease P protein subunit p21 [Trichoplax sp. H2]|nr:Ribonuclease P protein subunit p21 [Trichoplax sp. H2]|eukprot:RDD36566.1 Ribonuclease P protein subunit p21 [Trichoplax sp. H2]
MAATTKQLNVPNKEISHRINFMYQAAHTALTCGKSQEEANQLCRIYVRSLRKIAKKLVLRLDPNIKRTLCKKCDLLLIPGITSTIRHSSKREKHVILKCKDCATTKRFLSRSTYVLFTENPKVVVS